MNNIFNIVYFIRETVNRTIEMRQLLPILDVIFVCDGVGHLEHLAVPGYFLHYFTLF